MTPKGMQRPLVMHVVYRLDVGGLENGVVNLINAMSVDRWRHAVVALDKISQDFFGRIVRDDVVQLSLSKPPGHAVRLYHRLFTVFRRHQPVIVHTRNLAALEASLPACLAGVPIRVHGEHGREIDDVDGTNRRLQRIRKLYRPFVTRYIALSRDLQSYLEESVGIPSTRIAQIYNGVDVDRFYPSTQGRIPIPGCPFSHRDFWLVGSVGRMQAVKDQTNLAKAFILAVRKDPEAKTRARLILVGDGPLRTQVGKVLREGGVAELAWFAGERHDIPSLLRGLDCFVLPSRAEGISNTILEAMATAIPVVATRVGGNVELVADGISGLLVPAGDSEALASGILTYFRSPLMTSLHGAAGRNRVQQHFSIGRMVSSYESLYLTELSRRRPTALPAGAARMN